jgi:hypothetical protein
MQPTTSIEGQQKKNIFFVYKQMRYRSYHCSNNKKKLFKKYSNGNLRKSIVHHDNAANIVNYILDKALRQKKG